MSQVNSVKDLRNKHAKCLARNRGGCQNETATE